MKKYFKPASIAVICIGLLSVFLDYKKHKDSENRFQEEIINDNKAVKSLDSLFNLKLNLIKETEEQIIDLVSSIKIKPTKVYYSYDSLKVPYFMYQLSHFNDSLSILNSKESELIYLVKGTVLVINLNDTGRYSSNYGFFEENTQKQLECKIKTGDWSYAYQKSISNVEVVKNDLSSFRKCKYLAVIKENHKISPVINTESFSQGVILGSLYLFDMEQKRLIYERQLFATNKIEEVATSKYSNSELLLEIELKKNFSDSIKKALYETAFLKLK